MLNCRITQTFHDMPVGHVGHIRHWTYHGNTPYIILGHPGHLSHLNHLGNLGDLHPLDLTSLDPAPTDSLSGAFITEMDPTDPGPSEGCYADNSLDPLHTEHPPELHTNQIHNSDLDSL
jgi:hypothetical protein